MVKFIRYFLSIILIFFLSTFSGCSGGNSSAISSPVEYDGLRSTQLRLLPNSNERNAIRLFPSPFTYSNWQVFREWPNGEIRIFLRKSSDFIEVPFSRGSSVLANLVLESSGDLYIFSYDVETNTPSGRGLSGVIEGIDLWHFSFESSQVTLLASGLQLGGIDNILQARVSEKNVDVCTVNKCLRIGANRSVESWVHTIPTGHEIIEIGFAPEQSYALLRRSADHSTGNPDYLLPPYTVISLPYPGSNDEAFTYLVDHDCLPFRLRWEDGVPNWSCAKTASELSEVFKNDIRRVPHGGLGDIGLNNSEGRIAWSLVYSLNALMHLDTRFTPHLSLASSWQSEKLILVDALELIAKQGIDTDIGYSSRRYSQNRTLLLFALHLGRISQLLSDANSLGYGSTNIKKALELLTNQLHTLNNTAEMRIVLGPYTTFAYRKGIDFWADGSNVPYNYISGYVHGFLSSVQNIEAYVFEMKNLLLPLMENEILSNLNQWQYWWGYGKNGWLDRDSISVNTPNYVGSSGVAHISYRSMDAMAVLRLRKIEPALVDNVFLTKIRFLVSNGYLLPFVNQELVGVGGVEKINRRVALYYGRSASPSELHSQLFALESLADY